MNSVVAEVRAQNYQKLPSNEEAMTRCPAPLSSYNLATT